MGTANWGTKRCTSPNRRTSGTPGLSPGMRGEALKQQRRGDESQEEASNECEVTGSRRHSVLVNLRLLL